MEKGEAWIFGGKSDWGEFYTFERQGKKVLKLLPVQVRAKGNVGLREQIIVKNSKCHLNLKAGSQLFDSFLMLQLTINSNDSDLAVYNNQYYDLIAW